VCAPGFIINMLSAIGGHYHFSAPGSDGDAAFLDMLLSRSHEELQRDVEKEYVFIEADGRHGFLSDIQAQYHSRGPRSLEDGWSYLVSLNSLRFAQHSLSRS
jgi:hypothetical protein